MAESASSWMKRWRQHNAPLAWLSVKRKSSQSGRLGGRGAELLLRASEEAQVLVQGELSQALYEKNIRRAEVAHERRGASCSTLERSSGGSFRGLNPRAFLGGGGNG